MALKHYRGSLLGQCLAEALNDLNEQGKIQDEGMDMVNTSFDSVTSDALAGDGILLRPDNQQLADWYGRTKMNFKGHLNMFRGVDNVWTLLVTGVEMRMEPGNNDTVQVDALKIIAMQKQA